MEGARDLSSVLISYKPMLCKRLDFEKCKDVKASWKQLVCQSLSRASEYVKRSRLTLGCQIFLQGCYMCLPPRGARPNESSFQSLHLIKRDLTSNPQPPPKRRMTKDISREEFCCDDINFPLKKKNKKMIARGSMLAQYQ